MVSWTVHYDMRRPGFGTPAPSLYAAALEQAAWLDERGVTALVVSEHHGEEDGYLPSPLVMASALVARTSRTMISVNALTLTLHDPVASAEQCQVVDQISGGRLVLTLVPGYVEDEFALYRVPYAGRGRLFDDKLQVFLAALTGELFPLDGRTVRGDARARAASPAHGVHRWCQPAGGAASRPVRRRLRPGRARARAG